MWVGRPSKIHDFVEIPALGVSTPCIFCREVLFIFTASYLLADPISHVHELALAPEKAAKLPLSSMWWTSIGR